MNYKSILAIGAHPDDVEFSCLGFLLKLREQGAKINVYIASSGSAGDPSSGPLRIEESREAFSCVDSIGMFFNDNLGISENCYESLSNEIRSLIFETKPDLILVHDKNDTHQEHRYLHDILITAARRFPVTIFTYKSVSVTAAFQENVFVDIQKYLETKICALNKHVSQSEHEYMSRDFVTSYHQNWFGRMHAIDTVESYCVHQLILD